MIVFRIRGVKVSFDIGFLSIISFVMLSGGKYYGLTFVSCMIHELGHLIQMFLSDERVSVISFNISGITIVPCHKKINSFWNDICILLGGPFANLVTALFSFYITGGNINIFTLINLILGLFNLLPFSKLDGGSIVCTLAECFMSCEKKEWFTRYLCIFNIIILAVFCFLFSEYILSNFSLVIMIFYLFFTEIITMRNLK